MSAADVMDTLRRHILPHCSNWEGDLPSANDLERNLNREGWYEWTIDAIGKRDWKLDRVTNWETLTQHYAIRYRGDDPDATTAAEACNVDLLGLAS